MLETSDLNSFSKPQQVHIRGMLKRGMCAFCCSQWNEAHSVSPTIKQCQLDIFPCFLKFPSILETFHVQTKVIVMHLCPNAGHYHSVVHKHRTSDQWINFTDVNMISAQFCVPHGVVLCQ